MPLVEMNDDVGVLVVGGLAAVDRPVEADERVVDPGDAVGVAVVVEAVVRDLEVAAEPVLQDVVGAVARAAQGQAAARVDASRERVAGDLVLRVVELGADVGGVLPAGLVAGVEHLAALVHVGAELQHLVEREPVHVAGASSRGAGDGVVAGVPDGRVVVAQDAEGIRCGPVVGVDVVDVGDLAVGRERVEVVAQVVRPAGRLGRGGAGVVLGRDDEHAVVGLGDGPIGEDGLFLPPPSNHTSTLSPGLVPVTTPRTWW